MDLVPSNQGFSVDRWDIGLPIPVPDRSTGMIFGLPILVWVALPGLFSDVVSMVGFGVYCALAHDLNKCF